MKYLLLTILLLTGMNFGHASYIIHSVSGDVKLERGGESRKVAKGEEVKASDYVIIPSGGKIEIMNSTDKRIYTSIKPGKISITRLMIDAKGVASDNAANVASKMRFGRKDQKGADKLYVEKGMVRRSLGIYDPEGEKMEIDAAALGRYVATAIRKGLAPNVSDSGVDFEILHPADFGLGFKLKNNCDFPVYFNLIKISVSDTPTVEISRLGQPAGSYVILPGQTMSREDGAQFGDGETQLLILTHCQYDIDKVIEEIARNLSGVPQDTPEELPVILWPISSNIPM